MHTVRADVLDGVDARHAENVAHGIGPGSCGICLCWNPRGQQAAGLNHA